MLTIKRRVADDHEVVRCGLRSLFAGTEVEVVAEVATGDAAIRYALEHSPDVVLLDIRMPEGDGLTALGRIKLEKPDMPVLMLSTFDNPTYIARAVALGASGYVLKGCTRDHLINAIRTAAAGESAWTREELRRVTGAVATPRQAAGGEGPPAPWRGPGGDDRGGAAAGPSGRRLSRDGAPAGNHARVVASLSAGSRRGHPGGGACRSDASPGPTGGGQPAGGRHPRCLRQDAGREFV